MKPRKLNYPLALKIVGTVLIVISILDTSGLLEEGSLLETLVVPYVWLLGVACLVIGFGLEKRRRRVLRKSKKELEIELEAFRRRF